MSTIRILHVDDEPDIREIVDLSLGLNPDLRETDLTPGVKQIVQVFLKDGWPACLRLKPARAQTAELRQFLHGFLIFHLGRLPRGRAAALADEI